MYTPSATVGDVRFMRRPPAGPGVIVRAVRALRFWLSSTTPAPSVHPAVAEAAAVREFASRVRDRQPGFASDLLAAADRHERQFGVDL